jgi:hypothetical protein
MNTRPPTIKWLKNPVGRVDSSGLLYPEKKNGKPVVVACPPCSYA